MNDGIAMTYWFIAIPVLFLLKKSKIFRKAGSD
jgi:hypothetical protein